MSVCVCVFAMFSKCYMEGKPTQTKTCFHRAKHASSATPRVQASYAVRFNATLLQAVHNRDSIPVPVSSFNTLSKPESPPQAIHPCSQFQAKLRSLTPFGIAIFLLRYTNMARTQVALFATRFPKTTIRVRGLLDTNPNTLEVLRKAWMGLVRLPYKPSWFHRPTCPTTTNYLVT